MKLWVVLALLAGPLAAQSVRGRLEGRVPSDVIPTIDSLVQAAAQEGLPTEPLIQKAIEGAKSSEVLAQAHKEFQKLLDRTEKS